MKQQLRIRNGLIDQLMEQMAFTEDSQMAVVLNVAIPEVQGLREGAPASWDTIMRVAVLAGKKFDATGIAEPTGPGRINAA